MTRYNVDLTACTAGNPLKAWRGGTEPDDVWEDQTHDFGEDLEAAKSFIRSLHPDTSTHVVLNASDDDGGSWRPIYVQDFGHDDLDEAAADVEPASAKPAVPPDVEDVIPEAPPVMASQNPGG